MYITVGELFEVKCRSVETHIAIGQNIGLFCGKKVERECYRGRHSDDVENHAVVCVT